eukprot:scaffold5350_cov178-Ochromonas_danica.AAC.2
MNTMMKAQTKRLLEHAPNAKPAKVAITAICPMFQWGMLCVGSADCSMTLYELGNQDVCGRYTAMEFIPTAIECFQRHSKAFLTEDTARSTTNPTTTTTTTSGVGSGSSGSGAGAGGGVHSVDRINAFITIGDSKGHLHIIMLDEEFGSSIEVDVERWTVTKTFHGHAKSFHGTTPSTTTTTVSSSSALGISTFSWSSFSKYIVSGSDRTGEIRRQFLARPMDPHTMQIQTPKKDSSGLYQPLISYATLDKDVDIINNNIVNINIVVIVITINLFVL